MKLRFAVVLIGVLAAGCTDADWDHALNYVGLSPDNSLAGAPLPSQPAARTTPVAASQVTTTADAGAAPAVNNSWCRDIAQSAARTAAEWGYDRATQERRAQAMYDQCASGHGAAAQ